MVWIVTNNDNTNLSIQSILLFELDSWTQFPPCSKTSPCQNTHHATDLRTLSWWHNSMWCSNVKVCLLAAQVCWSSEWQLPHSGEIKLIQYWWVWLWSNPAKGARKTQWRNTLCAKVAQPVCLVFLLFVPFPPPFSALFLLPLIVTLKCKQPCKKCIEASIFFSHSPTAGFTPKHPSHVIAFKLSAKKAWVKKKSLPLSSLPSFAPSLTTIWWLLDSESYQ